jgi:hypothetical protein
MVADGAPVTKGFNCSNCGAAVELRALTHARAVVCTSCGAILDPKDPNVHILQSAQLKEAIHPDIPLGSRGTWHDHPWEVVGFQRRSIDVDGIRYAWDEYVLFNPYRGFRYLSNYEGHWNDISTIRERLEPIALGRGSTVYYSGEVYGHFQSATARTDFVLGEFPWRVRVGDLVEVSDFIAPPHLLSSERTDDEVTWSQGLYTDADRIWKAFSVPGTPRTPSGVFANQPSPYKGLGVRAFLGSALLAALLLFLVLFRLATADRERVFNETFTFQRNGQESSFVTEPFAIRAPGTIEIVLLAITALRNAWIDFDVALINVESGTAWNVSGEVSYYNGSDSDGPWTEDGRERRLFLPRVPAGQYYLRVEPEGDAAGASRYRIQVIRDVPSLLPYGVALALLFVPPFFVHSREMSFEHRRMQESDHGD